MTLAVHLVSKFRLQSLRLASCSLLMMSRIQTSQWGQWHRRRRRVLILFIVRHHRNHHQLLWQAASEASSRSPPRRCPTTRAHRFLHHVRWMHLSAVAKRWRGQNWPLYIVFGTRLLLDGLQWPRPRPRHGRSEVLGRRPFFRHILRFSDWRRMGSGLGSSSGGENGWGVDECSEEMLIICVA